MGWRFINTTPSPLNDMFNLLHNKQLKKLTVDTKPRLNTARQARFQKQFRVMVSGGPLHTGRTNGQCPLCEEQTEPHQDRAHG